MKAEMECHVYKPENTKGQHQKPGDGHGTDSPSEGTNTADPFMDFRPLEPRENSV